MDKYYRETTEGDMGITLNYRSQRITQLHQSGRWDDPWIAFFRDEIENILYMENKTFTDDPFERFSFDSKKDKFPTDDMFITANEAIILTKVTRNYPNNDAFAEYLERIASFCSMEFLRNGYGDYDDFVEEVRKGENCKSLRQAYRVASGYTDVEVAYGVGVSKETIYQFERSTSTDKVKLAMDIEDFLHIRRGSLFGISEDEMMELVGGIPVLRRLRTDKDLTLFDVAGATGLSESYISKVEKGDVEPSDRVIELLSDFHRVDVGALLRENSAVLSAQVKETESYGAESDTINDDTFEREFRDEVIDIPEERQIVTLKQFRKQQGLTQKQLAASLEISVSYLSMMEKGTRALSEDVVDEIRDLYGVEVGWR